MAVTIRGEDGWSCEWHTVDFGDPPRAGDLIRMKIPETAPLPAGFTRTNGVAWKRSDGTETGFPFPAAWFYGVDP